MSATLVDPLELSLAVVAAKPGTPKNGHGPFPAARHMIFGTAFALAPDLFLTAGHVTLSAASAGDVALAQLGGSPDGSHFELVDECEVFDEIDVSMLRCKGFELPGLNMEFEKLPIFTEVRSIGFALGLDPQFHSYVPRGFAGQIVSGHQLFNWRGQPLVYELSFAPPMGMSGAALIPGSGPLRAAGIVIGSALRARAEISCPITVVLNSDPES